MKKTVLLILSLTLFFSFSKPWKKRFVPPGMVQINDTLWADINEITNLSWNEYLFSLKRTYGANSENYLSALPDTNKWLYAGMTSNQPWQNSFRLPEYRNYPITAITYEQANAYCRWRTRKVQELMSVSGKYQAVHFEFRLPYAAEWEFFSNDGGPVKFENYIELVSKTDHNEEWKVTLGANCFINDTITPFPGPQPVGLNKSNQFRIYDMIGNAAEMTLERGLCKGGSWYHSPEESRTGKNMRYEGAAPWLGFRCVCVVRAIRG